MAKRQIFPTQEAAENHLREAGYTYVWDGKWPSIRYPWKFGVGNLVADVRTSGPSDYWIEYANI